MFSKQVSRALSRGNSGDVAIKGMPLCFFKTSTRTRDSNEGSTLVRELISNDAYATSCYNNYLEFYQQAQKHLCNREYILAKEMCDEAFSQLVKVDTITAAMGKDFIKIQAITDLINEGMSEPHETPI